MSIEPKILIKGIFGTLVQKPVVNGTHQKRDAWDTCSKPSRVRGENPDLCQNTDGLNSKLIGFESAVPSVPPLRDSLPVMNHQDEEELFDRITATVPPGLVMDWLFKRSDLYAESNSHWSIRTCHLAACIDYEQSGKFQL